jgi:hypothetical protein
MVDPELIEAAIERYVSEHNGYDFYSARVDKQATRITKDNFIVLYRVKTREELARYPISELRAGYGIQEVSLRSETGGPAQNDSVKMLSIDDSRKLIGIAGASLLLVGVLSPLVSNPMVGTVNYIYNGRGDGIFVLAVALISLIMTMTSRYSQLRFASGAAMLVTFTTLWSFQMLINSAKSSADEELAGNPFRGIVDMALASFRLEWGWAVLIAGSIALLVASLSVPTKNGTRLPAYALIPELGRLSRNIPIFVACCAVLGLGLAFLFNQFLGVKPG